MGFRAVQILFATLCAVAVPAASRATEARVLFGTGLSVDGITFSPRAFSVSWGGYSAMGTADAAGGSGESPVLSRAFTLHTGPSATAPVFRGTGVFSETADGGIRAEWRATADKAGRFAEAFVGTDIPMPRIGGGTAIVDGAEVPIPAARGSKGHLFRAPASSIELRGPDGAVLLRIALDEPTPVLLQDNRHWNGDGLGIRLFFATGSCEADREYAVKAVFHVGDSGSEPPSLVAAETVRIVAGPDWIPLAQEPWIEPGSALDFSSVLPRHQPAGKFGRVVARDGHFEFEGRPGVPQRFYGVNLCGTANLPESREEAERIAANLARMGYNAVRIHHHERWLVSETGNLPPSASADGTEIDPDQMAKFDLLVAACVKYGLYLTTDLFVSRSYVVSWRSLGIDRDGTVPSEKFKILCAFHEPAYSNLCAWARNFLTHVNPHTGRSLAEEPALATLALVNEGNLGNWGAAALRDSPIVATAWRQWLAAKRNDERRCAANDDGAPRQMTNDENVVIAGEAGSSLRGTAAHVIAPQAPVIVWDEIPDTIPDSLYTQPFATFLADAETRLYERLRDFVRDELHCPVPLSSISAWYEPVQYALPRAGFDYVDTHFYVDHPVFLDKPWRLPSRCPNRNPMTGSNRGAQDCVGIRQCGKPFTVSDFNFSGPGRYRGVGGIATGALAALQDWDGVWRFQWAYDRAGIANPRGPMGFFDIVNDPLSLAAERAALCLFLRGDLAPLEAEEPLVLDPAALCDPATGAPQTASLGDNAKAWKSRVGTRLTGEGEALPEPHPDASGDGVAKGTVEGFGEGRSPSPVRIDPATGTFLVDTPRTCGGFAESGTHVAGPLRFSLVASPKSQVPSPKSRNDTRDLQPATCDCGDAVAATIWVSSLDGTPIASSSHLLLTHLTDVQNTGIEYADPDLTILLKWGWLPHLMRNGAAEIELTVEGGSEATPPSFAVYRLSPGGRRLGEVPSRLEQTGASPAGVLHFTVRTDLDPAAATFLYEIVRRQPPFTPNPK